MKLVKYLLTLISLLNMLVSCESDDDANVVQSQYKRLKTANEPFFTHNSAGIENDQNFKQAILKEYVYNEEGLLLEIRYQVSKKPITKYEYESNKIVKTTEFYRLGDIHRVSVHEYDSQNREIKRTVSFEKDNGEKPTPELYSMLNYSWEYKGNTVEYFGDTNGFNKRKERVLLTYSDEGLLISHEHSSPLVAFRNLSSDENSDKDPLDLNFKRTYDYKFSEEGVVRQILQTSKSLPSPEDSLENQVEMTVLTMNLTSFKVNKEPNPLAIKPNIDALFIDNGRGFAFAEGVNGYQLASTTFVTDLNLGSLSEGSAKVRFDTFFEYELDNDNYPLKISQKTKQSTLGDDDKVISEFETPTTFVTYEWE